MFAKSVSGLGVIFFANFRRTPYFYETVFGGRSNQLFLMEVESNKVGNNIEMSSEFTMLFELMMLLDSNFRKRFLWMLNDSGN